MKDDKERAEERIEKEREMQMKREKGKRKVYLANCLGFFPLLRDSLERVVRSLEKAGFVVHEPFAESKDLGGKIEEISTGIDLPAIRREIAPINHEIGKRNQQAIDDCDLVIALLDGSFDTDSGVAAEIGYAFAMGKEVHALKTDFRSSGDNLGARLNLQVGYFISASGGGVHGDLETLLGAITTTT